MKVLHLPTNIASQISITVRALRDIGVDARGMSVNSSLIQLDEGIENFEISRARKQPIRSGWQRICWGVAFQSAVHWADVIHWHSNETFLPRKAEFRYLSFFKKPRIVEFWGSDIRIPEIAVEDNPYVAKLFSDPKNDYNISYQGSRTTQEAFCGNGFECLLPGPSLDKHIQRDLFPSPYKTRARIILSDFDPKYPNPNRRRPVVVHTPSRLMVKGTQSVLDAIEKLKSRYDFEFKLIHGVPHAKALSMVQDCDIMLDQFVLGSFGVAALEAMAMGKPVICYISPSIIEKLPSDFPVVNANQDNLVEVLGGLLEDGNWRNKTGRLSRGYVEKYHDAHRLSCDLVGIYENLITRNRKKKA